MVNQIPEKARCLRPGGDHEVPVAGNIYPDRPKGVDPRFRPCWKGSLPVAQTLLSVLFHHPLLTTHHPLSSHRSCDMPAMS